MKLSTPLSQLSIYQGYLADICGKSSGHHYTFDSKCDETNSDFKKLLNDLKNKND